MCECKNGIIANRTTVFRWSLYRDVLENYLYCSCDAGKTAKQAIQNTIAELRGEHVARDAGNGLEW